MVDRKPKTSSLSPRRGMAAPAAAKPWHRRSREEMAAETECLKCEVDLFAVAEALGYEPSGEAGKMSHPGFGDTIAISVNRANGHWCWINNRSRAAGTAIELIQLVDDCDFGAAIKKLRALAAEIDAAGGAREKPIRESSDRGAMEWEHTCWETEFNLFLNVTRGLSTETTRNPRFSGMWRTDERKNAVFPYIADGLEIVGIERRNRPSAANLPSFRSYSSGGSPGVWTSRIDDDDVALVITESPIDAMAFYQLSGASRHRMRFLSIRSGTPEHLIRSAIEDMRQGALVIAACDADEAGVAYNEVIARCSAAEGHHCKTMTPHAAKDWCELLLRAVNTR